MKYLLCETHNVLTLRTTEEPQPASGEIIVRLSLCGVCGTDTLKVYGAYPKPQKLGHEVVGTIHKLGAGVTQFSMGQRVALAHHVPDYSSHYSKRGSETMDPDFKRSNIDPGGFSEFIRVPATHVSHTVLPVPGRVPDERAVFMEPLACCLRATDRMNLQDGDVAVVVGVGAVGILFMPLLRSLGVTTIALDTREERLVLARHWGAYREDVHTLSQGRGADAVILTVVTQQTVQQALESVRDGGTIMIFGGKPNSEVLLPMWDFWLREINLLTSYSATPDGLKRAMTLLSHSAFANLESLISHRFPLDQAQQGFELAHQGRASKVVIG
jgi:L-iditol 2-dehydrogenase